MSPSNPTPPSKEGHTTRIAVWLVEFSTHYRFKEKGLSKALGISVGSLQIMKSYAKPEGPKGRTYQHKDGLSPRVLNALLRLRKGMSPEVESAVRDLLDWDGRVLAPLLILPD